MENEPATQKELDDLKEYLNSSVGGLRGLDSYVGLNLVAEIEALRAELARAREEIARLRAVLYPPTDDDDDNSYLGEEVLAKLRAGEFNLIDEDEQEG